MALLLHLPLPTYRPTLRATATVLLLSLAYEPAYLAMALRLIQDHRRTGASNISEAAVRRR